MLRSAGQRCVGGTEKGLSQKDYGSQREKSRPRLGPGLLLNPAFNLEPTVDSISGGLRAQARLERGLGAGARPGTMSPDFPLLHGPQRKEVGGTGCRGGLQLSKEEGEGSGEGYSSAPSSCPGGGGFRKGGVTLGGEGLGRVRGSGSWMSTSMKFGFVRSWWRGQLVGTWGQFIEAGQAAQKGREGAGGVGSVGPLGARPGWVASS